MADQSLIPSEELKQPVEIKDDEAKKILKRNGLTFVGASIARDLSNLGIHLRGIGIMHTATGAAFLNQSFMLKTMERIAKKLKKDKTLSAEEIGILTVAQSKMASAFTESQRLSVGGRPEDAPLGDEPPPVRKSFGAGEVIRPSVTVNIQNNGGGESPKVIVEEGIAKTG